MRNGHRSLPYRADIDGLRAVAVVAVVVYHAFPHALRGGFVGVDIFFVISGYLISSLVWRGLEEERFSLLVFYGRRALRLFPALAVLLAACLVAGWWLLIPDAYGRLGRDTAAAAVYVSNFVFWRESGYFAPAAGTRALTHLWSLGVEEQFYLLYPWLLIAAFRRRRATTVLLAALLVGSFALNVLTYQRAPAQAFYLLPTRLWELVAGAALAWAQRGRTAALPTAVANGVALAGVALLAVGVLGPTGNGDFPGWWALAPVAAGVLLIAAGPASALNARVLGSGPAAFVGRISYPLYLWHFPLLVFGRARYGTLSAAATLGLVAAAFVLACLTYWLVEQPVRAAVRGARRRRVPALAVALLALGGGGIAVDASAGVPGRLPFSLQKLLALPATYDVKTIYRERTCFLDPDQGGSAFASSCVQRGTTPLVFVWGDSRAAHLYPGLRVLAARHRFRLAEYTASSCPPFVHYESADRRKCAGVNDAAIAALRKLRPREVVLSAAWDQYPDNTPLRETIAMLRSLGIRHVVVVGPGPKWPQGLPQALYDTYQQTKTLPNRVALGLAPTQATFDREIRGYTRAEHATYVPSLALLCNDSGCLARAGTALDQVVIWDTAHFTKAGSILFARLAAPLFLGGLHG